MNRGASLARRKLRKRGAKAELARALDVPPDRVSRLLNGERLPNWKERAYFEDNLGIGWRLWDQPVSKAERGKDAAA